MYESIPTAYEAETDFPQLTLQGKLCYNNFRMHSDMKGRVVMDGRRMYSLIEKMNFVRVSGTPEEKKAADILCAECASFGLEAKIDEFSTQDGEVKRTYLEVLEPYREIYEAKAYRRSASLEATADMEYAEDALPVNLLDVKGKIIFINTAVNKKNYEQLIQAEPACVICGDGDLLDHLDETDLQPGMLRPVFTDPFEKRLCVVTVRKRDLYEMIVKGASKARVEVESRDFENTSRNVTAFIPGTKRPEEIIAFTAHLDSTQFSHGCYDNAAGSAILMELARHYVQNPPERSMRFIWTGSEERGLLGSKHFVANNGEEVKKMRLCINCDLAGSPAGREFAIVTGPKELTDHIDMLMKEEGYAVETRTDTYSSDCIPFADSGVPAVSIGRFGTPGMSYIHSRRDVIDYVCAPALEKTGRIALLFTQRMDKAVCLPFERKIPDDIRKKVDEYLSKKGI